MCSFVHTVYFSLNNFDPLKLIVNINLSFSEIC
nr:MAG TPA: hypothetical protein [Caudoviricetes sp.]